MLHFLMTMEFPVEIVSIIKEFSMPMTRPDWRTLHLMTSYQFHLSVATSFNQHMRQCLYEVTLVQDNNYNYQINFYNGIPYIEGVYEIVD